MNKNDFLLNEVHHFYIRVRLELEYLSSQISATLMIVQGPITWWVLYLFPDSTEGLCFRGSEIFHCVNIECNHLCRPWCVCVFVCLCVCAFKEWGWDSLRFWNGKQTNAGSSRGDYISGIVGPSMCVFVSSWFPPVAPQGSRAARGYRRLLALSQYYVYKCMHFCFGKIIVALDTPWHQHYYFAFISSRWKFVTCITCLSVLH